MSELTTVRQSTQVHVVSFSTGAVTGGVEQVILNIMPQVALTHGIDQWSYERANGRLPLINMAFFDSSAFTINEVVSECEEALGTQLNDDFTLSMHPLVETMDDADEGLFSFGIAHQVVDRESGDNGGWWKIEQSCVQLVGLILEQVQERNWDRKTLAPFLLHDLLSRLVDDETAIPARCHQISEMQLAGESSQVLSRLRQNAFQLRKRGVDFLGESLRPVPYDNVSDLLNQIAETATSELKDVPDVDVGIWSRVANKMGFTFVEAAYVACMVATRGRV